MITLAEAQSRLQKTARCNLGIEQVPLNGALGRVVPQDTLSTLDIPPSDNSAMDGFAVRAADAIGGALRVSQRVPAGSSPEPLQPGSAARIFTGGAIPEGADAVVIQENCEFNAHQVTIKSMVKPGDNIRPRGQDIQNGATVVNAGQRLSAIALSLLASIGVDRVSVYKPLKVALFSTGDELVEPGQPLKTGQIYNSNRTLLTALCRQLGFQVVDCGIVQDTLSATKQALAEAAEQADVIISSGGVSVGEEDHVRPAVESLGSLDLWKVQMKPGKPVAFGRVAGTPFLGLPGNPVSSFVVFQLLAVPLLQTLQGQTPTTPTTYLVTSDFDKAASSREDYIRARLIRDDAGTLRARPFANLSSGVMSSLAWADGLIRQPIDQAIVTGQSVQFLPLHEGML